jgi:hypothetical protein
LLLSFFVVLCAGGILALAAGANRFIRRYQAFADPDGGFANLNFGGPTDTTTNPFFQSMGTNGRSCVTCHQPSRELRRGYSAKMSGM